MHVLGSITITITITIQQPALYSYNTMMMTRPVP
jgi:hypothetical protein